MQEDARSAAGLKEVTEREGLRQAVKDWKVWWLTLTYTVTFMSTTYVLYLPTLAATLGFNNTISLLLCAPPSMLVAVTSFFHARYYLTVPWNHARQSNIKYLRRRHSDKKQERHWHVSLPMMVAIVGHIIVISTMVPGARYFGL